ncbi:methyl-accepting chemotaxis protein [Paenibacillus wynnii]|uniref:methyl-accepting chemotaxis protein n=1 Tax=Paenibacillus wynnii TaxID=268407 RepID=UPI002793153B|nr:methyl-accepting chemotaxis protein [Paenibacillus wynnii]MDQ0191778.1 methyl-accepting chemotaxis protein [Paenibacillus wynnii]
MSVLELVKETEILLAEGKSHISIVDYCIQVPSVTGNIECSEVLSIFGANEGIPCIVLCDEEQKPTGLLMRDVFYQAMAGRYAADLFYLRPADIFANRDTLTVEGSDKPEDLIRSALQREEDKFYDCVIVIDNGKLTGVLTVKDLMIMSGLLQERAEAERRQAVSESYGHVFDIEAALQEAATAVEMSQAECRRMDQWIGIGSDKLGNVKESYIRVDERMREQQLQVTQLLEDVAHISSLTREISGIAEKSGLLAMNASIEAAHAGEHGRGFQVVAGEVRLLALQTRQLSADITALLGHIGSLAGKTADLTSAGVHEIYGSSADVEEAGTLFGSLQAAVINVEKAGKMAYHLTSQSANQASGIKSKLHTMSGGTEFQ